MLGDYLEFPLSQFASLSDSTAMENNLSISTREMADAEGKGNREFEITCEQQSMKDIG
jgi:hypothetical protein